MAIGWLTKDSIDSSYIKLSEFEQKSGCRNKIVKALTLLWAISQAEEARSAGDFLSGRNVPIEEAFEDLNTSYEVAKAGISKYAFIALRCALDNGILAAYWKAFGSDRKEFRAWLRSAEPTPTKTKNFWQMLAKLPAVSSFEHRFSLRTSIANMDWLSDFVHTRGWAYSSGGIRHAKTRSANPTGTFEKWIDAFHDVVRIIVLLQLLVNPKLCIEVNHDTLIRKYGTESRIPFFGNLMGDYWRFLPDVTGSQEYEFAKKFASESKEHAEIRQILASMPDLSDREIREFVYREQQNNIEMSGGFDAWLQSWYPNDSRVDSQMIERLRAWAKRGNDDGSESA